MPTMTTRQIIKAYVAGHTATQIARAADMEVNAVYALLRRAGIRKSGLPPVDRQLFEVVVPSEFSVGTVEVNSSLVVLGEEGRTVYVADGQDVYRLEPGRKREWYGRLKNWATSHAARRIASPRTLPSDWDRQEVQRRLEGERL